MMPAVAYESCHTLACVDSHMLVPRAHTAAAQLASVVNPPRAIAPDDLREYCLFNDKLYSVGAFICAAKRVALTCDRGETAGRPAWKLSSSPDCEPNPSATPQ